MSSILSSVPVFTNPEDYQRYLAVRNQDVTGMGTKLAEDFNTKLSQYPNITPVQQFQAFENFKNDYKPYYLRQGYTEDQINKIFSEYDNLADPRNKEGFWGQAKGLGNQFLAGWEKTVGNMQAAINPDYAEDNMKSYKEYDSKKGVNAQIAEYRQQRDQAKYQQQGDGELISTLKSYFVNPRALVGGFTEEVAPQIAMTLPAVATAPFTGGTSLGAVAAAALASQGAVAEAGNFRLAMKDKINSLSDEQLLKLPQIQERMAQGMSLSEAKADFSTDFSDHAFGTGIAAGLGGLEGFSGLGKFGVSKGVTGALKTLVKEPVLQGVQEGAAQLNQNWWASNLDPNVKLGDDVGSSAALGMLFGAPIGAASAISQLRGGTQSPQQQAQQQSNAIINGLTGQNAQPTVTPNEQPAAQSTAQPATTNAQPTVAPTVQPTAQPTATPTTQPAIQPTVQPNPTPAVQQSVTPNAQPTVQPIQSLFQPTTQPTTPNAQPAQQNTTPVAPQVEETTAKTKITRNDIVAKGSEQGLDFNKWFEYKNELKATAKERAKSLGVKDYSKADPEGYAELNAELAQDYGFNQRDLKYYSFNYRKIKRDLENQAKSAVENSVDNVQPDAQNNQSSDSLRFSLNESNDSPFAKAVDTVAQGGNVNGYVNVGTTPSVLKMLGLPDVKVSIHGSTFKKVMGGKHQVTPETLKQLPQQINNPIAVMRSSTEPNGYVVLTELIEHENGKDKPVIAALHLKQDANGLELLNIASVYGRSNAQIQRGLNNDLLYWNKEKGTQFVSTFGLQSPAYVDNNSSPSTRNVKTENDLSQYQNPQSEQNIETNANPQLTQDRASLSRILGEDTAQHIELIDSNTPKPTGQDVKQLVSEGVEGWFDRRTQKIYLLSDGIEARWGLTREERLAWVAWHELAHAGVNVKYGNKLNTLLETAGKNKLVAAIARRIQREQGYNKHVALEEALVEIYAAHETGNWHSLETRYNITINERWRSGKDSVGDFATKMANYFRRLINVILGKNAMAETIPTSDVFKALHGVSEGIASIGEQSAQTKSDGVRFSLSESRDSDFAKAVDTVAQGGKPSKKYIPMGTTPNVLKMLGLPDTKVLINRDVLNKVMLNKHNVTAETLKQLPQQINDPVAVMKSAPQATQQGYVVLTELVEENALTGNKEPVISALHLKQAKDGVEVVNIASVYGKNLRGMQNMLNHDLLYWHKEKGSQFVESFGLQLPSKIDSETMSQSGSDIKTETDLSQYQSENSVKNDEAENSVDLENGEGSDVRYSRKAPKQDTPYQRDLMVTHNISAKGIMHAKKIGGLPFASVAVAKQSNPLTGFGEVTLIGDRDYIDPKGANKAKVFGADIYSPRYPSVIYDMKDSDLQAIYRQFEESAESLGDNSFQYNVTQNAKRDGLVNVLEDAKPVQYQFLKDNGIDVELVYQTKEHSYSRRESVKNALEKYQGNLNQMRFDKSFAKAFLEEELALNQKRVALFQARNDQAKADMYSDFVSYLNQELAKGNVTDSEHFKSAVNEIIESQQPTGNIDTYKTGLNIREAIKPHKQAFDEYVQEIADTVPVKEKLDNGETRSGTRKYVPHTIENVVKKLKKDLKGGEAFHYGLPSIRAKITPKFKSIQDIQQNKHRLVSNDDFQKIRDELNSDKDKLAEDLGISSLDIDNLLWNTVDENVSSAFHYADVADTPTNRQLVADFLGKLEAMPTEYFEGKAKDVTQFSDFSGAVIPNNLPKNAYDVLQQAGLKIYEYDPDVATSRAEIIKQATNELDEQSGGNILFSRSKPRSTDIDFENATPKRTANSFAQVKELAKAFLNKTLHNDETGIDAVISRANLEKMLSGKAHAKSTSLHDHLLAVANVDSLFKNAIHGWTEPYNKNDSPDVVGVHKMFAPLNIDGNVKLVKLTVKELKPEQGNRVYSVETIEIGNEKAPVPEMAELGFDSNSHRLHEGSGSNANVQSLIQRIQDFNSRDENSDIRYSKKQSAANLAQTGKAQAEPSILDDLKARDFDALKKRLNQATGKVDEWIADSLRPVNDWIDTFKHNGIHEMESEGLKQDMYRAKGVRDALNSEFEQHYLKPLMQEVAKIAKKNKLDELTAKRMVGFWMSTRYAIEKNNELLTREHQAMLDAKKAWDDAIVQGVGVKKAENAYLEAEQQYLDRKHDVELALNSTADFKVGTAGGWSNAEAADIMQNIEKRIPRDELMEAAKYIYRLNQARLKIDFESGRYTAAEFNEYSKNTHYVPLTGDPNQVNDFDGISGAGQNSLNITKDRALNGRKLSEAEDAIDASWRAIGRSTTYKGWADFKTRLDDLYESRVAELENQGYSHQAAVEETEKTLGISKQEMQGTTRTSDNALIRKQGGKYYEYRLPDKVMTALKNDNVEHANAFLSLISKPTSWYARGVTQWTVTFAPMNMMRDTWEKSEFIRVQKLFDANGKQLDSKTMASIGRAVLKNAFLDKGVWNATKRFGFGDSLTHAGNDAKLLKELLDLGGVSTYSTYLAKTETDLIKQIKQENSALGKRLEKAGSLLEGYNKTFDTVSALAAYKAMIEHGVDSKQAAATTLELTNFRKTGSKMRGIKALYMFSQPTAMGARNLIKYLSTSTGRKRFVGYMAVMIPLYLTLRAFDDEDEGGNKMDQLGDITRYIPIPIGGGHYLKIPVGFGMPQLAWNFATNIVKAAVGDISYSDALVNMAVHSSKTIAPISPSEIPASKHLGAKAVLTATPTILQPLMQIVLDRTAFGSKLTPGFVVDNKLKAEQSKSTTAKFWKDTALFLSDTLGIDMHPEQIKNLFDGYGSVLGSFKELQTILIENPNREQLGRRTKIPFLNQFIGTTNEFSIQSRYYEAAEEARNLANEYKSRKERGNLQGWATPEIRQKVRFHELAEQRMAELRAKKAKLTKALNAHQLSDTAYNARLKGYNKQVDALQRVLLKRWRKMEGLNTIE